MLKINTVLKESKISGTGCFADEFIEEGQIIWELYPSFDIIINKNKYEELPDIAKKYIDNFAYYNELEGGFILCSDNAKYFNHSEKPNCIAKEFFTVATRNIEKGEEITEDYYNFDELAKNKLILK